MAESIPSLDVFNPPASFSRVSTVYTDLDGTMLGPGGTILTDADGTPSVRLPLYLEALDAAGIDVVIATGRNRAQVIEIARVLHLRHFIGELGGYNQYGFGSDRVAFFNHGLWPAFDEGNPPTKTMDELGIIDHLCSLYPGRCVRYPLNIINAREVSVLVLGSFDVHEAAEAVSLPEYPVNIIDNGEVAYSDKSLDIDEGIHIYHVLPKGISKGEAIRADLAYRHIDPSTTIAIGDSCGDIPMGDACGRFVLTGNGASAPEVVAEMTRHDMEVYATKGRTIDGWVEFASALLFARGVALP